MTDKKTPELPTKPCYMCGHVAWYLPGDEYIGPSQPICGVCHPDPRIDNVK